MKLKCDATIKIAGTSNEGVYGPFAACVVSGKTQGFRVADREEALKDVCQSGTVLEVNIPLKVVPALRLFLDRLERRLQRLAKS